MKPQIARSRRIRSRRLLVLFSVCFASCASVSTSETHRYPLRGSEFLVSARAERGSTADHLFIVVNGVDAADGPFGPAEASGTILRGHFRTDPVEAHCGHRWRPGLHIGYRCRVSIGDGNPIEVEF